MIYVPNAVTLFEGGTQLDFFWNGSISVSVSSSNWLKFLNHVIYATLSHVHLSRELCQQWRDHALLHSSFERDGVAKTANRDAKKSLPVKRDDACTSHCSHLSSPNFGGQQSPLMMTWQIAVMTSDGWVSKARALLDCTSSTSFVTERLAHNCNYLAGASVFKSLALEALSTSCLHVVWYHSLSRITSW